VEAYFEEFEDLSVQLCDEIRLLIATAGK